MDLVLRLTASALGVSGVAIAVWCPGWIRRVYRRRGWTLLPPVWTRLTIAYEILACSAIALGLTVIDPSSTWAAVVRLLGVALFLGSFGLLIYAKQFEARHGVIVPDRRRGDRGNR